MRTRDNTAVISETDVIRPSATWDRASLDCAVHNAVIHQLLYLAISYFLQVHGTRLQPLTIPEAEQLVRVLKRVVVNGRTYFLALQQNADGDLHVLADMPQTHRIKRNGRPSERYRSFSDRPYTPQFTRVCIRGNLGVVPCDNIALLEPMVIPNVTYKMREGRNSSLNFSSRQTLTNSEHHILTQ